MLGSTSTEISSVALGGRVLSTSDEWFAPASSLLKVGPRLRSRVSSVPRVRSSTAGRRVVTTPTYDWVILRLGPNAGGRLIGFDVDTANFIGNEAPEISIHALTLTPEEEASTGNALAENDARWETLVPVSPCGPSQSHLFKLEADKQQRCNTHVKLHMIPDGGIARFRVYGVIPPPPVGQETASKSTLPTARSTCSTSRTASMAAASSSRTISTLAREATSSSPAGAKTWVMDGRRAARAARATLTGPSSSCKSGPRQVLSPLVMEHLLEHTLTFF